jgi:pimeloyl-ACP methyl ester carboxylesterase
VGGGGVKLAVRDRGPKTAPAALFVHGFTQSGLCFTPLFAEPRLAKLRLVSFDLRGHGRSGKPSDPRAFNASRLWAEDVAAVIAKLKLVKPVLVGWSYGGLPIFDYVRHFGQGNVAGIVLIGAISKLEKTKPKKGSKLAKLMSGLFSEERQASLEAIEALSNLLTLRPLKPEIAAMLIGEMARVKPEVRRALLSRAIANDDLLPQIELPVLIVHGDRDAIIPLQTAKRHRRLIPNAKITIYRGIGHMPFLEDQPRFCADLLAFVKSARAR